MSERLKLDSYAYDVSKNAVSKGEVHDEKAINQSIENILLTMYGERLFNLGFGSPLMNLLFETVNESDAEIVLDNIIDSIETYETRILILREQTRMKLSEEVLELEIPYVIKQNSIVSLFNRKIMV